MITLENTIDEQRILNILMNEELSRHSSMDSSKEIKLNPTVIHLMIQEDNKDVGIFMILARNTILAEMHVALLKEVRGTGLIYEAFRLLKEKLQKAGLKKLIHLIPENNLRAISAILNAKGEYEGSIKQAVFYKNRVQDLTIYSVEL